MQIPQKKCCVSYQGSIVTVLILASILSVIGGLTIVKSATAEVLTKNQRNLLPIRVEQAVKRDLARRKAIAVREIKTIDYEQKNWNNGCLELPQPDELCTQVLVPGWRVVVSNNAKNWIYHTNRNGRYLRLAAQNISTNNPATNLPESVKDAVLQAASQRLQMPSLQLKITQSQPNTWNDGCLNLAAADELCTQALVPGWRVTVTGAGESLVYHTNESGSLVRLNKKASSVVRNPRVSPL
ncbi:hypothetical protein [Umezakia ovalisporum]|uniref:Uncharacterized protein n=2 Tax=Umezakia ovalisporum TaxID=75695 RepID=A0AA43GWU3_9CYAN|nr:hypothetical protein [Umezakia ovalisporum]MDH6056230.1 hypothetical protein [Umezakia ovalisporum FSS-43]MDH6062926.1 hypothetical protein [Umezakia ovalisporum FSS-62]MDH6067814.1 hypothetical protein [Umezakia ovalisporum APH033B]MDH6070878.1 hypothetical protein [Umezakia ovalisporum CobakiLakeA]MDH6074525.1 hypothetical protein [Umezakia ovalisporum CS-1034]